MPEITPRPRCVADLAVLERQGRRLDLLFFWGLQGSTAKFAQNPELRDYLLGTGDRVLVEASPVDRIWGIGLTSQDEHARHPSAWRGLNLLGFALMDARDAISPETP